MAGIASYSTHNRSPLFQQSVVKLLDSWSALQVAIENGQGGAYGKEIALWMRGAVENFFYENDDLGGDEVAEFISTIMNQELDTLVEDNSLEDLGNSLCHHFRLAISGRDAEILELHKSLDATAAASAKNKPKVKVQNDDSSSEEGSEDEDMETDDSAPGVSPSTSRHTQQNPQHHRTGHNLVSEPDEDGWVTVVKNRK